MHGHQLPTIRSLGVTAALLLSACSADQSSSAITPSPTTTPAATVPPTTTSPRPTTVGNTTTTAALDPATDVAFTYSYAPPDGNVDDLLDNFPANPPDPANGMLGLFSAHGTMTFEGDFTGTAHYVFGSTEHPTGFLAGGISGVQLALFIGTVEKCGIGTLVLQSHVTFAPAGGSGGWSILPGFGTGELAGVTGQGDSVDRGDGSTGSGEMTGQIMCADESAGEHSAASTPSLEFGWTYGPAENTTDPGGIDWQVPAASPDPANGKLGLIHGHGTVEFTGDLTGTARRVWTAVEHPKGWLDDVGTRTELFQFVGTVSGCGAGTMVLRATADFGPGFADVATPVESQYRWEVVPGYGTGALATATGEGAGTTQEHHAGGTAALQGTIECGS